MSGIYTLLILSSVLAVGTALKCYKCRSSISWDDCISRQESENDTCHSNGTRCGKAEIRVGNKETGKITFHYYKDCWKIKECNKYGGPKECDDGKDDDWNPVTCNVQCCSGDNCNNGTVLPPTYMPTTTRTLGSRCPPSRSTLGHMTPVILALISVIFSKMH